MTIDQLGSQDFLYSEIGQLLVDLLPPVFECAWIRVEMLDDVWSLGIFFKKEDNRFSYINENLKSIEDKFRQLRETYRKSGQEPWKTATFQLSSAGRMSLDLGYEDISDFGRAPERRVIWMEKYLGKNAQVDWS